ncbi:MAG: redox-regulated ATPase YchF [Myxococcales bacterium]|jgi:GTP-binding protein YchF|nr:redox-regulated ATPase YchF [Myxococcales bacterium]
MSLSIGIVGLPNVGKSTLFNALTKAQNAEAANYPFCTIEPNKAVVPVPDARLAELAKLVHPERVVASTVDFIDIAGLVEGASKGEGLGNKFLGNIRETQAILEVVRCFENDDVVHVSGSVDPIRDVEVIDTELILSDLQTVESRIERLEKQLKADKSVKPKLELAQVLLKHLEEGKPARGFFDLSEELHRELISELSLLTSKRIIYCANVDEAGMAEDNAHVERLGELARSRGEQMVKISAKMEEELVGLDEIERAEFLGSFGVSESGLEQVIRKSFDLLGLSSYFTAGPKEVRAWTIHKGWSAPKAASVIHTDFERGFIRAEVISYDDYIKYGNEAKCRAAGVLRIEGKEYKVQDGDVMHFLFNV